MPSPRRALFALIVFTAWSTLVTPARAIATPAPVFPPLPHELFDVPIRANGCFGDHRSNHFHAGLDLDTGGSVGRAVHAPADAEVKRIRASGVGYGRSLYLEAADGRLLVFGHLDAFAEPVAGYVASVQDSTGQYEQDLWPTAGRFRVQAGDVIGWSGRSGTGGPHLHVEIRRGDMAINPLLAGYTVVDASTPRIERVTLAPLDSSSFAAVAGRPLTLAFGARDSLATTGWGRLRVVVEALDAESDGTYDVAPWRVRVAQGADWVQCEFDSASWATDMPQSDFVYDRGRYTANGKRSLLLAAPEGFRPRPISASAPGETEAGVVTLDAAHPQAVLAIEAEDLAGHSSRRFVRIVALEPPVAVRARATKWNPDAIYLRLGAGDSGNASIPGAGRIEIPQAALCERTLLEFSAGGHVKAAGELAPLGKSARVLPASTPLRAAADVALALPRGATAERAALYRDAGDGWEYIGDRHDSAKGTIGGGTRHLGRFALFRDTQAPRVRLMPVPTRALLADYPKWALEATLSEAGSGVDARATYFTVDGRRVPSEWDSVINVLRWKPLRAPSRGRHVVGVVATDRAGNVRKANGSFVVD